MSTKLYQGICRAGFALALAVGLIILITVATPLMSEGTATIIGLGTAQAGETSGSGG